MGSAVIGGDRVVAKLKEMAAKVLTQKGISVTVGFTASYAIFVHERTDLNHNVGQAKFLEQPAREMRTQLTALIVSLVKRGVSIGEAMLVAGQALQAAAQKLSPVDTGNLKASAFTRLDRQ